MLRCNQEVGGILSPVVISAFICIAMCMFQVAHVKDTLTVIP